MFSLKSMLMGVTYVAVAATACVMQSETWTMALWLVSGLAVLYSILAVVYFRGRSQAMALGFTLFSVFYAMALWRFPAASPAPHFGHVLGLDVPVKTKQAEALGDRLETLAWELMAAENASSEEYQSRVRAQFGSTRNRVREYLSNRALQQAFNAIAVMLSGLLGCLVGAHVWKVAGRDQKGRPQPNGRRTKSHLG